MKKSELRKLRMLYATRAMVKKAKTNDFSTTEDDYRGKEIEITKRSYGYFARGQLLSGILKIAFYPPEWLKDGIRTPRYEVYLNLEGKEYTTRLLAKNGEEEKWSEAMIENLPGLSSWELNHRTCQDVYMTKDLKWSIERYLGGRKGRDHLGMIQDWEQAIKDRKTKEKEAKITAPWDEEMRLIPKLPKGFKPWLQKWGPKENHIVYVAGRNVKEGYCVRCQKPVAIHGVKYGKMITCPSCRTESKLISEGKMGSVWPEFSTAKIVQRIPEGIVVRDFQVRYVIKPETYKTPEYSVSEVERNLFYDDGRIKSYWFGLWKNKYNRWYPIEYGTYWYYRPKGKVYPRNLKSALKGKHTGYYEMYTGVSKEIDPSHYIGLERKYPILERLVKAGLIKLATDVYFEDYEYIGDFDENQTELLKQMGIDQARLKRLRSIKESMPVLRWLRFEKKLDTIFPDDVIKNLAEWEVTPDDVELVGYSATKVRNYLSRQQALTGYEPRWLMTEWRDYLNMAEDIGMDISKDMIRKPKNLQKAHQEVIDIKEANSIKEQADEIRKKFAKCDEVLKTIDLYEYSNDTYTLITPKRVEDIVREGTVLRHCVHTCDYYFDRIQNHESYLVFLRKSSQPDVPWYTLEVEPGGNIRQKRTTGDCQNEDLKDALPFLREWQQVIKKRLGKKEREYAKKADKARKKNYQELRINQNKVWHGKLKGQLLVDVLEKDFMEAM